ncbi:spermatogenesis-associated protein 22 [Sphaerodactylus townsendi]|uniref:spermatogenesis-associated protein 22 n=1 Tax=Sphaerodactylus townsendi TaxID=933632 RepID=UPI002026EA32|nr:spermatogenesis-associated protein 22 [Sphaerodactylus townsendi]
MKRNFTDSSTRTTAGCLPVPLFNQKKRTRQPLTSNPLKNEAGTSNTTDPLDLSTMLADFGWEAARPRPTQLQNTASVETENNKIAKLEYGSGCLTEAGSHQQKLPGPPTTPKNSSNREAGRSYSSATRPPELPNPTPRGLLGQSTSYTFRHSPHQQKTSEKQAEHAQGDKMIQKVPPFQLRLKEKDNSLRILSVVIESMKHWSQYAHKALLLFEVLGILDSAVTPGQYGAKTFLLRDGKESVSCVFYEIDRELPRLIRGRVHRCVGNYDTGWKLFRCVSVRPASVPEQQTFQDFVRIADVEMGKYVRASSEI